MIDACPSASRPSRGPIAGPEKISKEDRAAHTDLQFSRFTSNIYAGWFCRARAARPAAPLRTTTVSGRGCP